MQDLSDSEFLPEGELVHIGPTTLFFTSRGAGPSEKLHRVAVKQHAAELSPYVITLTDSDALRSTLSAPPAPVELVTMNLLGNFEPTFFDDEVSELPESFDAELALSFTREEIAALLEDDEYAPRPADEAEIFVMRRHPFSFKAVFSFTAAALLFVAPIAAFQQQQNLELTKVEIMNHSSAGMLALKNAKKELEAKNPESAVQAFAAAETSFSQASSLADMNIAVRTLATLLPEGRTAASGGHLLVATTAISGGAATLSEHFAGLSNLPTLTEKIRSIGEAIDALRTSLGIARQELAEVSAKDVPNSVPVDRAKDLVATIDDTLPGVADAIRVGADLLGADGPKRYLVLFQNSNELRPTGGFLGSFALVDVDQGAVTKLEIPGDGSYNLQGQLKKLVRSPEPLWLVSPKWQFQDSNWFFDFPSSAEKMAEFYRKSGGPSVDGVISVNSGLMEGLLAVTGPLDIPGFGTKVDSKNFAATAQKLAQFDYDKKENKPKAFLGALAPVILGKVQSATPEELFAYGELLSKSLRSKDLQLHVRNEETAGLLHSLSWDGAQNVTDGDYLAIANANVAGGKTDGVIEERVDDQTLIEQSGTITKTVTLTRTHRGTKDDVFTGDVNQTYHRFYVPAGSVLIAASGLQTPDASLFGAPDSYLGADADLEASTERIDPRSGMRIGREGAYTTFGGWSRVAPGETATIRLTYRLPKAIEWSGRTLIGSLVSSPKLAAFGTVYDAQSGSHRTLHRSVTVPAAWQTLWHDEASRAIRNTYSFEVPFDHTIVTNLLLEGK